MALNASSHNTPGEKTGPTSGQPPPIEDESKNAILEASNQDPSGQSVPGRDGGEKMADKKVKSEKELEKERQKLEKQKKFEAKQAKQKQQQQQQVNGAAPSKPKEREKKKQEGQSKETKLYVEETPKGEKKILKPLDDEFHKAYIPGVVESAWGDWWEKEGFMKPEFTKDREVKEKGKFVIAIPPPNVTGALHCGHAIATALQDTLIRYHRMKGFTTLYIPGCDHAGIATQSVVEKMLWRRQQKTRYDLGRTKFLDTVQDWKEEYHQKINRVFRRLGGSMDWSREAFTMSPQLSKAVTETFVRLHEEGLIYRSNRLVNWCTRLSTALSQVEVDNKELTGTTKLDVPGYDKKIEFGTLTYFKYPIDGADEAIEVATTRPETMLGDTGIAVNPKDSRYQQYIGKKAKHPFIPDRQMPIIADEYVDPEFGTGAVKLTPAHDPNDFALGSKHNLQFLNILNDDGTLNQNAGPFQGKRRFDVRYEVIAELTKMGLFSKQEPNPMKVPICSRSGDVIEPIMKPQWWMQMKEIAQPALDVVRKGEVKIKPAAQEKIYCHWLENINDWCLSRQLWWGHQIPAYFVHIEGETDDQTNNELWVTGRTEDEARGKAESKYPNKKFRLQRDPDVLDTWFSSGLWPFSTLGWPDDTHDLQKLYPTTTLETGWDILFPWVARMIMMGLKLTGKIPFSEVYCHSLIRDSEGRKMSKSLGNVIDPVDILDGITLENLHAKLREGNLDPKEIKNAEKYQKTAFPQGIPECGADALRFSLVQYTTGGGDINFDVKVMASYRRFCNKIYQATKYVLGKIDEIGGKDFVPQKTRTLTGHESLPEKWILHKMNTSIRNVNQALQDREFSRSTQAVYQYWYYELCDVYIENSKTILASGSQMERQSALQTLYSAIESALLMIHPFMPFLSEEMWQRLPRRSGDSTPSIVVASYPEYDPQMEDSSSEAAYELVLGASKGIRSLLAEYSIKDDGATHVQALDETSYRTASEQSQAIKTLAGKGVNSISILGPKDSKPPGCAVFPVSAQVVTYVHVKGRIDIDAEIEKAKSKLKRASDSAGKQQKILSTIENEGKASEAVVDGEKTKLKDAFAEVRALEDAIGQFEELKLEN